MLATVVKCMVGPENASAWQLGALLGRIGMKSWDEVEKSSSIERCNVGMNETRSSNSGNWCERRTSPCGTINPDHRTSSRASRAIVRPAVRMYV